MVVEITPRTIWLAAGIAAGAVVSWLVISGALPEILLIFIAIVLAEGIRPLVDRLDRWHMPRPAAVLLIFVVIIAAVLGVFWLLLQPLITQTMSFVSDIPRYVTEARNVLGHAETVLGQNQVVSRIVGGLEGQIGGIAQRLATTLLGAPLFIANSLFKLVQILLVAFFWLTAISRLRPFLIGLLPPASQSAANDVLDDMSLKLGGYFRGVIINMIVIGTLSGIGLLLLGVPYPALLGVLAGLTETLPFIGPWIGGAPAVLLAILSSGVLKGAEVVALYIVIQQIEGNTLVPWVMNREVHLNPLTVVLAVFIGGAVLGLVGAVLGVPLAVVLQVVVVRVLAPAARRAAARHTADSRA